MTTKNANDIRALARCGALLAVAVGWSACGERSALHASSTQPEDQGGAWSSEGGAAGSVVGGGGTGGAGGIAGGAGTGGSKVTSSGGDTTLAKGGSGGSMGSGGGSAGRGGSMGSGGGSAGRGGSSAGRGGSSAGRGGTVSGGGTSGGGGRPGTGGASVLISDAAPSRSDAIEVAPPVGTPAVDPDTGGITVATGPVTMSGYVTGTTQGSGSSISLTYNVNSFCASGSVGASPTYNSWAVAGFSVNQSPSQESGSEKPLVLNGSEISVTYSNRGGSRLEFQLWDGTGGKYWCNYLPPSATATTATFKFSDLNSKCWDGSGTPFVSGTVITAVQLLVPGDASRPTPFEYCFLGLRVN